MKPPQYQTTCARKVPFVSRREAITANRSHPSGGLSLTPYRCVFCQMWHLGTKPDFKRLKRRKKERDNVLQTPLRPLGGERTPT